MLHKFLNDFLALAPLQLPELINQERMEQPVYEDGYVLLDFKLEKPCPLEEVMNLFEDQMELVILYHKVTSVHTEFGQFCCAFSNPNFGRMYKMNASTDANGNVHSVMVTIYESLEFMYGDYERHAASEHRGHHPQMPHMDRRWQFVPLERHRSFTAWHGADRLLSVPDSSSLSFQQ